MSIENKLGSLGLSLPPVPKAIASYIPANLSGKLVFTSGQLPSEEGKVVFTGKVGIDSTKESAGDAAKRACLNALAAIKGVVGDLDSIHRIVKLGVYVASSPDFYEQHIVANSASDLLLEIFGERGRHARFAIGVSSLPLNAVVELELTVELI